MMAATACTTRQPAAPAAGLTQAHDVMALPDGTTATELADAMPDPYAHLLDAPAVEWRWLPVAAVLVFGAGVLASHVWPWGVLP